ncbi:MAG TPA: nucleotide exchange factor GrpE [Candidatus Acidoferrales bacterium]|nr:nucleotide exchange factor GrpE [Candidatus Acidoferrales bacterium]
MSERERPEQPEAGENPEAAGPAAEGALSAEQLTKLQAEKEELRQTLIRRQADFENYRKRVERERHEAGHRGVARLIEGLLPILDAFDRALAAHDDPAYEEYWKGFELIYRQLWETLARHGLERIKADGRKFDPHVHHAVERVESHAEEEGTVLEVLEPGYTLHGRVLRPATVRVAVHPAEKAAGSKEPVN